MVDSGVSTFVAEAGNCASVPADTSLYGLQPTDQVADLKRYFERPTLMTQGLLSNTPGLEYAFSFHSTGDFATAFTNVLWDRLDGAVGIRGTLKFHLHIAASAFNQGIIALAWQYGSDLTVSNWDRGRFFPLSVNLPHARLNVASETMTELTVPFVSHAEYIPQSTVGATAPGYGTVYVTNLTGSRVVVNQDSVRYKLYVTMHDIELIGATPITSVAVNLQSGVKASPVLTSTKDNSVPGESEVTREAVRSGIISDVAGSAANLARAVARFPPLSAIGGSAGWFLSGLAKTAKALGYSKPMDETQSTRVLRSAYNFDSHIDVPSAGFTLSNFQSNTVNVGPELGLHDEDEMILSNVLGRYQYIYHGVLTNSNSTNDTIYGCPLCPGAMWFRDFVLGVNNPQSNKPLKASNTLTENSFLPSTLCYVGDNFRVFRGGFKFRISFAKTKLHGGRLLVSYVPYVQATQGNLPPSVQTRVPSATYQLTGSSMVIDLRDDEVFEFEAPYVSWTPYMPCNWPYGDLSIVVLEPLRSNASVPSTVDFMVEVAAMPDFEFAIPVNSLMSPVPQLGTTAVALQSGAKIVSHREDMSQQVIGEKVHSIKQLIMMPDYVQADLVNNFITRWNAEPWFKGNHPALSTPMSATAQSYFFASKSSRLASLYAFAKGGTMYTLVKDIGASRLTLTLREKGNLGGATLTSTGFYNKELNSVSPQYTFEALESTRVKVPLYGKFARFPVQRATVAFGGDSLTLGTATTLWDPDFVFNVPEIVARNQSGAGSRILVGRAAADDATLSRFLGPPPCIILNSLATVSPCSNSTVTGAF